MNQLLIICGPTASSKTALAIECAKILNSEVISADSMNVYKGLNIGTAKPSTDEMQGIKHHLIDVVNPTQTFSVGDYKEMALPIIEKLHIQNKIPVICGGTGFYINSLIYDLSYGKSPVNFDAREKYKKIALEQGNQAVFDILLKVDPESAKKLHVNDIKRVIRALEIYESGTKKSDIVDDMKPIFDYKAYSFDFPRADLYNRIDLRVDQMISQGLIEEVKNLYSQGINETYQCMQGIGYKEIVPYLKGESNLEKTILDIKLNTRHYAKRQITFFKKLEGLIYLTPDDVKRTAERIIKEL